MFPIRDTIPSATSPLVNYAVILACSWVFLLQVASPGGPGELSERYGMVPVRIHNPEAELRVPELMAVEHPLGGVQVVQGERPMHPAAVPPWLTMLTCIFLHGSWMHFIGNMWFLYIFGDNIEDRMGHWGYGAFYLGSGLLASVSHYVVSRDSGVPTIGASGAIAGVMGAYFCLYPRAHVVAVVPIAIFLQVVELPAAIFLGIWFLFQFFQGAMASAEGAGVAWWAHIGGFVAGIVLVGALKQGGLLRPARENYWEYEVHKGERA